MADVAAEWRVKLEPWLGVLRDYRLEIDLPKLATSSDMQKQWLHIFAPQGDHNKPVEWIFFAEALELIELLARVEYKAAWRLMFEIAKQDRLFELCGDTLLGAGGLLPRFIIQVEDSSLFDHGQPSLRGLLRLVVSSTRSSPQYQSVKEELLAKYAEINGGKSLDRETDGRVKLSIQFEISMRLDEWTSRAIFAQIQEMIRGHDEPESIVAGMGPDSDDEDEHEDGDSEESEGDEDKRAEDDGEEDPGENAEQGEDDEEEGVQIHTGDVQDEDDEDSQLQLRRKRGVFTFESFQIHFSTTDPLPSKAISMINSCCASTLLQLTHFSVSVLAYSKLDRTSIDEFLAHQMMSSARDHLLVRGIENLTLDMGAFDVEAVRSFCSAIVHSRDLGHFTFDEAIGESSDPTLVPAGADTWWPWLTYALFSRDATHHIESVALNVKSLLSMATVDTVREVAIRDDPLRYLYETGRGISRGADDGAPKAVTLIKSGKLRLGPYDAVKSNDASELATLEIQDPDETFQVVRNRPGEDFVEVFLPGSGVCWTKRTEILQWQPLPRRDQHSVRHLTLKGVSSEQTPPALALLEIVGGPLEQLTLADHLGQVSDEFVDGIRRCCPNLKRLGLESVAISTFDWLCEPPEVGWKLEKLTLDNVTLKCPRDWSKLFDSLSDSVHPLSRSLRELHVAFRGASTENSSQDHQEELMDQCINMLSNNVRLGRCEVFPGFPTVVTNHEARFMAHHNAYVSQVEVALSTSQKLAFLSVTTATVSSDLSEIASKKPRDAENVVRPSARFSLSCEVCRLIFELAATPKRRVCRLELDHSERDYLLDMNEAEDQEDSSWELLS